MKTSATTSRMCYSTTNKVSVPPAYKEVEYPHLELILYIFHSDLEGG